MPHSDEQNKYEENRNRFDRQNRKTTSIFIILIIVFTIIITFIEYILPYLR